jgi:hypothetical protein
VGCRPFFWSILLASVLPAMLGLLRRSVDHLFRAPVEAAVGPAPPGLIPVWLARVFRATFVIGAVFRLAWA